MGKDLDGWLTVQEVADRFDIEERAVLRMIRLNRLQATKKGWVWLVHKRDLPKRWPPALIASA